MSGEYPLAQPRGYRKIDVYEFADQIAEISGYKQNIGGSLESIVRSFGGSVAFLRASSFDTMVSGSILVHSPDNFDIFLSDDAGPARSRFTIAHELGHLFLHYDASENETMRAERYGTGPVEWEANWFAAGFLMPKNQFNEQFDLLGGNLALVASKFGVSIAAAEIQAKYLGAVN